MLRSDLMHLQMKYLDTSLMYFRLLEFTCPLYTNSSKPTDSKNVCILSLEGLLEVT